MKKEQKPKHGGTRPNAGRKPKYKAETTTIAFRVPKNKVKEIKKIVNEFLQSVALPKQGN